MRLIESRNESRYTIPQCEVAELLLKEKEKILLVEPDNILQGKVLSRLGYNVQIHQGTPPHNPKYKIGDILLDGKFTHIKNDGKKETINHKIINEKEIQ